MNKSKELKVAIDAISKAGKYLVDRFHRQHKLLKKADQTTLLKEDLVSEKILMDTISKSFPSHSFFTEERDTKITSDLVWVFDPLCGTFSYYRGVETWSISAALVSSNQYLLGVVLQPLLGNLYYAQASKGAFVDGKKIHPAKTNKLAEAFISVEHAVFMSPKVSLQKLIKDIKRIRVAHGSGCELANVAAGHLDGLIKTDQALTHFAGGRAILEAAGGAFIDFNGRRAPTYLDKNKSIDYVACAKPLAQLLLKYVKWITKSFKLLPKKPPLKPAICFLKNKAMYKLSSIKIALILPPTLT